MLKNKIVLVTGGAGFIGSHLIDESLKDAEKVICFDNFAGGNLKNIAHLHNNPKFQLVVGDISDYDIIKPYVEESDVIFHEAASKLVVSLKNPRTDLRTNTIGTFNILEIMKNSNKDIRMIHASTGSVLGSSDTPMKEDHYTNPTTLYGISKLAAEKYVIFYAKEFGLKTSVLRYFHVFGPRQDYSGEAGVVSIFLSKVLRNQQPVIYTGGNQVRCFTFVKDDVEANMLLLKNNSSIGEIYNAASKTRMTINELASTIISKYGNKNLKPMYGKDRQGENLKPIPDTSKIESLGFKERVSFEEGLELTKKWVEQELR